MSGEELGAFGYTQQLKRNLGTMHLTAFGLNYMIPLSPAIFFGFVLAASGGSVALPFIVGGIAIFFTAMSYAIMVKHFPLAGSLYNFISRVWGKHLGFLAGWVLLLDYLFITTVTSMSASVYLIQLVHLPYIPVLFGFILVTGLINIFGIELLAWISLGLLALAEIIVIASFIIWSHFVVKQAGHLSALLSLNPFHVTNFSDLMGASALAIASYLGFDAITTLAEEAKNPTRTIPKAILLCLFIGGIGMVLTGYFALLAAPDWQTQINNPNWQASALFYITKAAGGQTFATLYSLGFIISMAVFNIVATAATARLLFGMGRDGVLTPKIFAKINFSYKTPHWNVLLIMVLSFIVGSLSNIAEIASLVNYGALFGFACLNLAVLSLYFKHSFPLLYTNPLKRFYYYILSPFLGFIIVAIVFASLSRQTHICGTAWLEVGILYLYWQCSRAKHSIVS